MEQLEAIKANQQTSQSQRTQVTLSPDGDIKINGFMQSDIKDLLNDSDLLDRSDYRVQKRQEIEKQISNDNKTIILTIYSFFAFTILFISVLWIRAIIVGGENHGERAKQSIIKSSHQFSRWDCGK
jgi:hypothetical protein